MVGWSSYQKSSTPKHPGNIGGKQLSEEFGMTPLTGYRSWTVVNAGDGTGLALQSLHLGYIWKPGTNTADCNSAGLLFKTVGQHDGPSPDINCACGFYSQLPTQPLDEWERLRRAKVSATGTVAMWGRIIVCQKGYKAEHVQIESPVVLELSCQIGCDNLVTRVELPAFSQWAYTTYCDEHKPPNHDDPAVTVEAGIWLKEACKELSTRYENIEFLNWSDF